MPRFEMTLNYVRLVLVSPLTTHGRRESSFHYLLNSLQLRLNNSGFRLNGTLVQQLSLYWQLLANVLMG